METAQVTNINEYVRVNAAKRRNCIRRIPVDTGRKLNVHKTSRRRPGVDLWHLVFLLCKRKYNRNLFSIQAALHACLTPSGLAHCFFSNLFIKETLTFLNYVHWVSLDYLVVLGKYFAQNGINGYFMFPKMRKNVQNTSQIIFNRFFWNFCNGWFIWTVFGTKLTCFIFLILSSCFLW